MAEDVAKPAGTTQAEGNAAAGTSAAAPEAPEAAAKSEPQTDPKPAAATKSAAAAKPAAKDKTGDEPTDPTAVAATDTAAAKPDRWAALRAAMGVGAPADAAGAKTEPGFAAVAATEASGKAVAKAASKSVGTLFGSLDADERLRQEAERNERTLWAGAVAATLLYASLIAGQMVTGFAATIPLDQQQQERRGQDGPPDSISVELVPDPDKNAKTKHWQDGTDMPAPQPSEQMPQPAQPPQTESLEQPELKQTVEPEDEQSKEAEETKSGDPMLLDLESLAEAAAADFSRQVDRAFSPKKRRQEERRAVYSAGAMKVRGTGASGKSDEFTRSVIDALMKTRPGPFAIWGRVLVSFEISPSGTLNYVRVLDSSGNSALDQAAVNAIHKARFKAPPPGLSAQQRTYIIDYIFG